MKRIFTAAVAVAAIAAFTYPANALSGRFEEEFYEGLGNNFSGRFEETSKR